MSRQRSTPRKVKDKPRKIKPLDKLTIVHPHAAGLDIGARETWACVPASSSPAPVRAFGPFTPDLHALADWLIACGIDTVAMESTGVYWIPIFEVLEARGFKVFLVNSWHLKHVPGRKSDVLDCQWIQQLHSLGLLRGSFRPDAEMCALRSVLRHRATLIEHRSPHILHLQKALLQINLQLPAVISDVMDETGQAIIRAIVAGERDPLKLAHLRFPGCKSSEDDLAKALTGTPLARPRRTAADRAWQSEHLFELKQNLQLVDYYTQILRECDAELERRFAAIKPRWDAPAELPQLPKAKADSRSKNAPAYNARAELYRITASIWSPCKASAPHSRRPSSARSARIHLHRAGAQRKCRCLRRQDSAQSHPEDRQPCGAGFSSGRRLCPPQRQHLRRVLPPQEGPTRAEAVPGRHRAQDTALRRRRFAHERADTDSNSAK